MISAEKVLPVWSFSLWKAYSFALDTIFKHYKYDPNKLPSQQFLSFPCLRVFVRPVVLICDDPIACQPKGSEDFVNSKQNVDNAVTRRGWEWKYSSHQGASLHLDCEICRVIMKQRPETASLQSVTGTWSDWWIGDTCATSVFQAHHLICHRWHLIK